MRAAPVRRSDPRDRVLVARECRIHYHGGMKRYIDSPTAGAALDSIMIFAFFAALTSFVEATYIFGLLGTDIPPEIVYVLFLLSPFLLLLYPKLADGRIFMLSTGSLGLACWILSLPLGTRWRMLFSGLGCGLLLLFFAAGTRQVRRTPAELAAGLGAGVLLQILFRAARSGNLFLEDGYSTAACALLAVIAIALLAFSRPDAVPESGTRVHASIRSLGMTIGLFSAMVLLYFAFTSPAVMARWSGMSYPAVVAVEAGALALFTGLWLFMPGFRARLSPGLLAAWNLAFIAALAAVLRLQQPPLGAGADFPVYAAEPGLMERALFWVMLVLHPVIFADFALLGSALRSERPSPRGSVRGFAFGSLLMLLLVFFQIFTTVYDYIPLVGPWFRDRFWLVMSVPGIIMALSILLVRRSPTGEAGSRKPNTVQAAAIAAVAAGSIAAAVLTGARPAPVKDASSLGILTYNIQQGCGKTGEISIKGQMAIMRSLKPDIIGLQETDTARAAGGNSDIVRFLADGLGMYSYYGPSPVSGTFGIALLSRYPILNPRTFFMPSRGEQTAAIEAEIDTGSRRLIVLVTHLDNDGALPQARLVIDSAARAMKESSSVIAMGDFNFNAATEQYRETAAALEDAWEKSAERTVEPGAPDPAGRIDHIFVSPDTRVMSARYLPRGLSDHPAMFAEIAW